MSGLPPVFVRFPLNGLLIPNYTHLDRETSTVQMGGRGGEGRGEREREKVFERWKSEDRKSHQDAGYFKLTLNGINDLQPPHSQCQDFYQVMCCLILSLQIKSQSATIQMTAIKDGAYFCYCAYVLRISRYSGLLWVVPTNTRIFCAV